MLDGGSGKDQLHSGGNHKVKGRGGIDQIYARKRIRNLKLNCGAGSDRRESAQRDKQDPAAKSC